MNQIYFSIKLQDQMVHINTKKKVVIIIWLILILMEVVGVMIRRISKLL